MLKINIARTPKTKRFSYLAIALVLATGGFLPILFASKAGAAQLTGRSLQISTAQAGQGSVQYTYTFTNPTGPTDIQSIKFVSCTTAFATYGRDSTNSLTGCTAPTGQTIQAGSQQGSLSGNWQNTTAFTRDGTGSNNCAPGANLNVLCITRTATTPDETATSKSITWNGQTNPTCATSGCTFFVGIYLYSDAAWTTPIDSGTVASAVTQTLTVSAYVAEVLNFCVGSTSVNDAATSVGAACTNVSGTTVNLGVLDSGSVNVSPVDTTLNGNNLNGVAMIRTNAINGATVSYIAIQQSGTNQLGTLRISGASCNATDTTYTDECIRAQGTTQSTFNPSADERFGMTVAAINCGSVTSYSCVFDTDTYNLKRDAEYDGDGTTDDVTNFNDSGQETSPPTTSGYAWDASGTADIIASSTGSSTKVIDDEALVLKFAAYSAITTPFGTYTAQGSFIALATY
jgi:hypothetical protein